MDAKTAQAQAAATKTEVAEKTVEKVVEKPVVKTLELSALLGRVTTRILEGLKNSDTGIRQSELQEARRELRIWYESQSVPERKAVVKDVRKTAEDFKHVAEQIHADIVSLILQDS